MSGREIVAAAAQKRWPHLVVVACLMSGTVYAQRPSGPALLAPQNAPALDYVAVPDSVALPGLPPL